MGFDELKKVGKVFYLIFTVVYGIYAMITGIVTYTGFEDITQGYQNIAINLSQKFVTDIVLSTTTCPDGYESIFGWDWLGTVEGCDCTDSIFEISESVIAQGTCSSNLSDDSCVDIPAQPSFYFNAIEGASDQKEIVCISRTGPQFSDIVSKQTGTCESTQKTCGNPNVKESIICVDQSEPCPIYKLKLSETIDLTTFPANEWKQLDLTSGKYLYVNYNGLTATTLPSSEFRFTQVGVCTINNYAKQKPEEASDYVLSSSTRESCSDYDSSFEETHLKVPENTYYKVNLPSDQWAIMSKWNQYDTPTQTDPFLSFQRQFIHWKIEARDQIKGVVDSAEDIANLKDLQLTVMIVNIIVCIFGSIIMSSSQVLNMCDKEVPCFEGDSGEGQLTKIELIKDYVSYAFRAFQLPFLIWAFVVSIQKKNILIGAADANPSEPRFNSELAAFATQLKDDVYKNNLSTLIFLVITIVIDVGLIVYERLTNEDNRVKPSI